MKEPPAWGRHADESRRRILAELTTLCAALEVHCTYRADQGQVTIRATITDSTPGIVTALLARLAADDDPAKRSPAACAGPQADAPRSSRRYRKTITVGMCRPAAQPAATTRATAHSRPG
ncbi:MAG: hypothetical protein ACRDNW_07285 [Trebonia sp.]